MWLYVILSNFDKSESDILFCLSCSSFDNNEPNNALFCQTSVLFNSVKHCQMQFLPCFISFCQVLIKSLRSYI